MARKKQKARTITGAYFKGFGTLIVGALGVVGAVFAWRFANMLFDKMLENGKMGRLK